MAARVPFRRKANRLSLPTYAEPLAISLTIATKNRLRAFVGDQWASACVRVLGTVAKRRGVLVFAYCIMPDHVHLVAQIPGEGSVVDFVKEFKQRTGFAFKRATGRALWQKSYYDHFLRRDENLLVACRYVFANPVRAGMVDRAATFAFSGSLVWDRDVLVEA